MKRSMGKYSMIAAQHGLQPHDEADDAKSEIAEEPEEAEEHVSAVTAGLIGTSRV